MTPFLCSVHLVSVGDDPFICSAYLLSVGDAPFLWSVLRLLSAGDDPLPIQCVTPCISRLCLPSLVVSFLAWWMIHLSRSIYIHQFRLCKVCSQVWCGFIWILSCRLLQPIYYYMCCTSQGLIGWRRPNHCCGGQGSTPLKQEIVSEHFRRDHHPSDIKMLEYSCIS